MDDRGLLWVLGGLRFPPGGAETWLESELDFSGLDEELDGRFEDMVFEGDGATVREALDALVAKHPELGVARPGDSPEAEEDGVALFTPIPGEGPDLDDLPALLAAWQAAADQGARGALICRAFEGEDESGSEDDFVWIADGTRSGGTFRGNGKGWPPTLPLSFDQIVHLIGGPFGARYHAAMLLWEFGFPLYPDLYR